MTPSREAAVRKYRASPKGKAALSRQIAAKKKSRKLEGSFAGSPKQIASFRANGMRVLPKLWEGLKADPAHQKGPQHLAAKRWILRAPNHEIFDFVNLAHFVREHQHFFDADDVVLSPKFKNCRAFRGLSKLNPLNTVPKGTWKGWTWVSTQEWLVGNNSLLDMQ